MGCADAVGQWIHILHGRPSPTPQEASSLADLGQMLEDAKNDAQIVRGYSPLVPLANFSAYMCVLCERAVRQSSDNQIDAMIRYFTVHEHFE